MWVRQLDWIEPIEAARRLASMPRLSLLDSAMAQPLHRTTPGRWSTTRSKSSWSGAPLPPCSRN